MDMGGTTPRMDAYRDVGGGAASGTAAESDALSDCRGVPFAPGTPGLAIDSLELEFPSLADEILAEAVMLLLTDHLEALLAVDMPGRVQHAVGP